jgi:hypothetical protein
MHILREDQFVSLQYISKLTRYIFIERKMFLAKGEWNILSLHFLASLTVLKLKKNGANMPELFRYAYI